MDFNNIKNTSSLSEIRDIIDNDRKINELRSVLHIIRLKLKESDRCRLFTLSREECRDYNIQSGGLLATLLGTYNKLKSYDGNSD